MPPSITVYEVINNFLQTHSLNFSRGKKDKGKVGRLVDSENKETHTHTMLNKPLGNPGFLPKS